MNSNLATYFRLLILTFSGMLLPCIAFAFNPELANGITTGKVFWFFTITMIFAICVIISALTFGKPMFRFTVADGLVGAMGILLLLTYDWKLNPNPEKLIFILISFLLWFMLRSVLITHHVLRMFYLIMILCTASIQAVWGIFQLYGISSSNHTLFQITGTFFNPGPFSGYLAVVMPIALGLILKFHDCKKSAWWQMRTLIYYFSWLTLLLIVVVLPAGMSRSAWLAAAVSCIWVYLIQPARWNKVIEAWKYKRNRLLAITAIGIMAMAGAGAGIYHLKKDSADGRLLMWKVSMKSISEDPLTGKGLASFPAAYARVQADYFKNGNGTVAERMLASNPDYAFNEFIHFTFEHGLLGTLLFIFWIGIVIYTGIRNKRYATTGGLISLAVFSLTSYPLQLPSFWMLLIFLSAIAVSGPRVYKLGNSRWIGKEIPYVASISAAATIALYFIFINDYQQVHQEWNDARILHNNKAYEAAVEKYEKLYPYLHYKKDFLFESAQCLSNCGQYKESNELLERASLLSGDPMIRYIMAKNWQELGNPEKAEKLILDAIDIVPERIYPYYLLSKLYADPAYLQEEKLRAAADSVLYKKAKVESTAIRQMREEVEKLISVK